MTNATCSVSGCDRPVYVAKRGLCRPHYKRWWTDNAHTRRCSVDDCTGRHEARGYCPTHLRRFALYGDPLGEGGEITRRKASPQLCQIGHCSRQRYALGLCELHYARRRRHGGLHDKRAERGDPVARFWSKVEKTPTCWLWTSPLNGSGYGSFNLGGDTIGAHVASLLLAGIEVPPGTIVHHTCRVRQCVNPEHLRVTTQAVNTRLAVRPKFSRLRVVSNVGSVYYLAMGEHIKIGYARDVLQRVRLIRYGFKAQPPKTIPVGPLRLLATHSGGSAAEQSIHRCFAAARVEGEWFRATGELLDHIAHVNARHERRSRAAC